MALRKGFGVSGSGATAEDFRRGVQGAFVLNSGGSLRAGVLAQTGNLVTSRASMGVTVGVFQAVLAQAAGGALPVQNDGGVVVSLAAAPASNSRIDVIYVKHNDAAGSDADSVPVIAAATGTAAASPVKPAIPAGALELATVTVPAGATTTQSSGVVITQTYAMTAAAGGVVPLRSAVEQSAFAAPEGQLAVRLDTAAVVRRSGSAWVSAGGQSLTGVASPAVGSSGSVSGWFIGTTSSVTFATPFAAVPDVQLTGIHPTWTYFPQLLSVTTTGFTYKVTRLQDVAGPDCLVRWRAELV